MELKRNAYETEKDLNLSYSYILNNTAETDVFDDECLREQDKRWALSLDINPCIQVDLDVCFQTLEEFAKRGLFFCYAKILGALLGRIPNSVWAERFAHDIHMEEKEAKRLVDFVCAKSDKKLLVFYEDVWLLGGIERVVTVLLNGLKDEYRLLLVTSKKENEVLPEGFPIPEEVEHVHLIWSPVVPLYIQVATLCLSVNAAMLIGNPNIEQMFMPVYGELKGTFVKSIAVNHYFYYLPLQYQPLSHVEYVRRKTLNSADAVVWLTRFSATCGSMLNNKTVYIPNPNTFPAMASRSFPKEKVIMAVGRFYDPLKRIDRIFSIFKKVLEKEPDAKLWLVGQYNRRMVIPGTKGERMKKLEHKLNLPKDSVVFWGPQKNVLDYYLNASVLLFPSECEGYGMVLKEAGTAGTPVVVNDFPGSEDIVKQGENGYRFNMYSEEYDQAADCIVRLLNEKDTWLKMSKCAQAMAEETSTETVTRKWKRLIENVLSIDDMESSWDELYDAGVLLSEEDRAMSYTRALEFLEQLFVKKKESEKKTLYFVLLDIYYYLRGVLVRTKYLIREIGFRRTLIRIIRKLRRKIHSI